MSRESAQAAIVGRTPATRRPVHGPGDVVCDACGREAPRAEMMPDADPDTESGYVCAEGHGCLVVLTPEMRLAGIVVPAPVVAAAPPETPAAMAGTVWERAEAKRTVKRMSALADAELLVGGSAHVTPADMTPAEAAAVRRALRRVTARFGRLAVEVALRGQQPGAVENAALSYGQCAAVLARWMRDEKVRR